MPQPRYQDIRRFCEIDDWEEVIGATGRTGDHHRYRKVLADGSILRTKVSHGSGRIEDPDLWRHIWRDQLGLDSEEQFWQALKSRRPVDRGGPPPSPPQGPSVPAWVVAGLLQRGVPESEIRAISPVEARRLLQELWSRPPDEPA